MGKLYWIQNNQGKENLFLGYKIYNDIFVKKKNVIFLTASETRNTKRDFFDTETTESAWRESANRDMRMIRYLIAQDINVVYCSSCEFQETKDWVEENIKEVEIIFVEENNRLSYDVRLAPRACGTMYWVTGLSGAGKTTIGTLLYHRLKKIESNVLLLDGDMFRDAMNMEHDYSRKGRESLILRNLRLEKLLLDRGVNLVCCTISMINRVREWNRKNLEKYIEIYLEVPMSVLEGRDSKGLYAGARNGTIKDVVGVDQEAEFPMNPEIKVQNDGTRAPEEVAEEIWDFLYVWTRDCSR